MTLVDVIAGNPAIIKLIDSEEGERQRSTNSNFRIASVATTERPLCSAISGDC